LEFQISNFELRNGARPRTETVSEGVKAGRVPVLDGLRGIAILLVMFRHSVDGMSLATAVDRVVYQLGRLGSNGVDVFFVLSGFLITGILLDTRGRSDYFSRFYFRRTVRIFPLYYITLVALFLLAPRFVAPRSTLFLMDSEGKQIWYWTYLSNWLFASRGYYGGLAHFWSLAVEEQYYVVWATVVLIAGPRRMPAVCLSAIGLTVLARLACAATGVSMLAIYVMTITRLDGLALGSLLAAVARRNGGLARFRSWYAPMAAASMLLLVSLIGTKWGQGRTMLVMLVGALPVAVMSGALMALSLILPPTSWLAAWLSGRVLRFFGKYSYALYVLHPMVYAGVRGWWGDDGLPAIAGSLLPGRLAFAATAMSASVVAALLSWHLWEKHWLQLKERWPWIRPGAPGSTGTGWHRAS
jgi:peptidoglycan/LPS O-acetylase OafA/YrhL